MTTTHARGGVCVSINTAYLQGDINMAHDDEKESNMVAILGWLETSNSMTDIIIIFIMTTKLNRNCIISNKIYIVLEKKTINVQIKLHPCRKIIA